MSANIGLSLSATKLEVVPGESVEATATIRNQSQVVDQFDIRIEGLDPAWWTLSTSSVSLFPGDQGEAKLTIHPPKEAEVRAGSYSFQVRAVSQANPEEMTEEEAYLILRGFMVWDVEMSPTNVVGGSGTYRITASNSGNTDITLTFEGKDPEEALDYTFSHDKVTVPAGESALITLKVRPRKGEKNKLYSFQVLVRPAGAKVSSKEVKAINGKLEYKRGRRLWKWILLGLAIAAVIFLVWKFILQVPAINSFDAYPESIAIGGESTLSWNVSGAHKVTINPDTGPDIGSVNSTGTHKVSPTTTTTYNIEASNAVGRSRTDTVTVTVILPPNITSFDPDPPVTSQILGSTLSWVVSDADVVTITDSTTGYVYGEVEGLNEKEGELTVYPQKTTTYTLEASNMAGIVKWVVTVTVPVPDISSFIASRYDLDWGDTTLLKWRISDVGVPTTVTITYKGGGLIDGLELYDQTEVTPGLGCTIYTLKAATWAGFVTDTVEVCTSWKIIDPFDWGDIIINPS